MTNELTDRRDQVARLFANPAAKHVELDENGRVLNVTAEEVARELGEDDAKGDE